MKASRVYLTTDRLFSCFQLHPKVICTAQIINSAHNCHIISQKRKLTVFISIIQGLSSSERTRVSSAHIRSLKALLVDERVRCGRNLFNLWREEGNKGTRRGVGRKVACNFQRLCAIPVLEETIMAAVLGSSIKGVPSSRVEATVNFYIHTTFLILLLLQFKETLVSALERKKSNRCLKL